MSTAVRIADWLMLELFKPRAVRIEIEDVVMRSQVS